MSVFTRNPYLKLLASLLKSLGVSRVDDIDENVGVLEIVPPVGPSQCTRKESNIRETLRSPAIDSKESISPANVACGGPVRQSCSVPAP
jgi:hypothetical protein